MKKFSLFILSLLFCTGYMSGADWNVYVARYKQDKACAISYTFDDGLAEHYTLVAPQLEKRGFRGTFWICGSNINKDNRNITDTTRMTWPQLKEMSDKGHEISNHGWAHKNFARFPIEEIKEDEESPTLLSNNSFSASMEGIVESYGLPKRGEFDPTTIMSFFYVFFFGMMLSDAAYGAIIAVACFVLLKKFPRMSRGMYQSIKMFMYCGISTLIWGILFGGYFGNIVDIVSQKFFGTTITVPALWFIPLNDPMKLLMYSMLFGMIHLFVGLGIKGYMCLKEKKIMDFFCDVVLWFMLLIGLILMLLPSEIFSSISQIQIVFPDAVNLVAKGLAIAGAVGILLMSGRDKKNPALRLALGAYDLYNITGWLSDVLSYSRLLALGLATGVIASVINQMGSMLPNNIAGVILFLVIFVIGHTLNLAINLLGAYVHTNRLQFVEFFGKFYEGGGRAFHPFTPDTKYVDVKEES